MDHHNHINHTASIVGTLAGAISAFVGKLLGIITASSILLSIGQTILLSGIGAITGYYVTRYLKTRDSRKNEKVPK